MGGFDISLFGCLSKLELTSIGVQIGDGWLGFYYLFTFLVLGLGYGVTYYFSL